MKEYTVYVCLEDREQDSYTVYAESYIKAAEAWSERRAKVLPPKKYTNWVETPDFRKERNLKIPYHRYLISAEGQRLLIFNWYDRINNLTSLDCLDDALNLKLINEEELPFSRFDVQYQVKTGSNAYGINTEESDLDVYGWCIPYPDYIFPTQAGWIPEFNERPQFEQVQDHHLKTEGNPITLDISIYNITKYFRLLSGGNPNILATLFVPEDCIISMTTIGRLVRENRKLFLSTKVWDTFKGFARSQLRKVKEEPGRPELVEKFGFDVKYASHMVRLCLEVEQLLKEGDLDLRKYLNTLKAIRQGEWTQKECELFFTNKISDLEEFPKDSILPEYPDGEKIKELLYNCLEEHFGDLKQYGVIKK